MTDRILELAEQSEADISQAVGFHAITFTPDTLRKFAALVRREALEEGAQKIAALFVRNAESEWGKGYAQAQRDIHEGIRALAAQEGDK